MKRAFITAIITGVLQTICLYSYNHWTGDSESSAASSASFVGGVTFVLVFFGIPMMRYMQRIDVPKIDNEETFFHADWVTYPFGWDLVGGALYLTSKRLFFCRSRVNFHNVDFSLPISNITDIRIVGLRFVGWSRLVVSDRAGKETVFIIRHPKIWAEKMRLTRENAKA